MKNYEIFCNYLGFDVAVHKRMKSIINRHERTPSLFFYYNETYNDYFFKDFSSGIHGGAIKFIMLNEGISYEEAIVKANNLYSNVSVTHKIPNVKEKNYEFQIDINRDIDLEFWKIYQVDESLLIKHDVYPVENVFINGMFITHRAIGYFNKSGKLMQIYMPANSIYNESDKKKFFTVNKGYFYCNNGSNTLILTKSKKDIIVLDMIFKSSIDLLAPMSETTKIDKDPTFYIITSRYKKKFINFDNDETGRKQAERFQKMGFELLLCNNSKDVSDGIKNNVNMNNMFNIKIDVL